MSSDDKAPVKLSLPLEFQQDIFHEIREEDALVLLARGLGLLRVVTNLLHAYDAAGGNLILLVGADDRENGWIGEALAERAAISMAAKARGLNLVNTDMMSVEKRGDMYREGGIFSITSQILIVDFLVGLLEPATVTGVVVLHAERVVATSLEAFILRVYRQKNKEGFLKAFSDTPESFYRGFSPLATMLRNLFLRKPLLYPRFHVTVAKSLEGRRRAEVIELDVPMTEAMRTIQNAVMECVEVCIGELKKSNSGLEMDDWNLDSALHKSFDSIIRRQLDPVWHRTSFKTRQIVRDLTLLRNILHAILEYDAVSFNRYLDTVLAASQPEKGSTRHNQSPWLFLDAAHTIFETAKRRVYTGVVSEGDSSIEASDALRPVLEEQPKWAVLAEILEEIERDVYFNPIPRGSSNGSVLIMCGDQATARQLREYLQTMHLRAEEGVQEPHGAAEFNPSGSFMMRRKLRSYLLWKREFAKVSASLFSENQKVINNGTGGNAQQGDVANGKGGRAPPNKRRRLRGGSAAASGPGRMGNENFRTAGDRDTHISALMADLAPTDIETAQKGEIGADPLEDMEEYFELYSMDDLLIVHPYDGDLDEHILDEVRPRYIIMYEPDAAFIRRVEVYRSSHTEREVRVYFMYYGESVEEQRYLSGVRREKDAFTQLIKERGSMTVTLNTAAENLDPQETFLRTLNTRIAGGGRVAATAEPPRVVVDVREFRSSLPSLLHGRNLVVIPCMLTVGDYVLTPDVVIERKSVRDLVQSLNNGRLFNQAEMMFQHYKSPMLLIEFEHGKSFTLEPFADISSISRTAIADAPDLQAKLVMLTLAFPKLRIIWSSSPYQTAEIFEELKKLNPEPDPVRAAMIGLEGESEAIGQSSFSQVPLDMLRTVPGITEKGLQRITLEIGSLIELANTEEDDISQLIGKEAGRQIFKFFNRLAIEE